MEESGGHLPPATTVSVARQRIEDGRGKAVGVEVLFRPHPEASTSDESWEFDDDLATATVIAAVTSEFKVQDVSGDGLLFINMPRSFLVGERPVPLPSESVVLEILERVTIDAEVLAGMDRLLAAGFALALDDVVLDDPRLEWVDRCMFVKVDLEQVPAADLPKLVHRTQAGNPRALMIAERVETVEQLQMARAAGFDLFQGFLINRPTVLVRDSVRHYAPTAARLLAELGDPAVALSRVADLVEADPALGKKILTAVNSVAGVRTAVPDMTRALTLLGRDRLHSMLVLQLLGDVGHYDSEIPVLAVARTRAVQVLCPQEALAAATAMLARLFTSMLGVSPVEVEEWFPQTDTSARVVAACDALDQYLDAVDTQTQPVLATGFTPLEVSMAWLRGLQQGRALIASLTTD